MKYIQYILLIITITYSCLTSAYNNNGQSNPLIDSIGHFPSCVHFNLDTGAQDKYAFIDDHETCPDFSILDAQPLNHFELQRVVYSVPGQFDYSLSKRARSINLTQNVGHLYSIMIEPIIANRDLHPDDHTCQIGIVH